LIRKLELDELFTTELLGKSQVSNAEFQEFIGLLESGPLSKLNDLLLQMLSNAEILGVLVYENVHLEESV